MTILSSDLQVWPWPSTNLNKCFKWHSTPQREQLCQIILTSMHKCRIYGLDKLNLWLFYHLTFKCDLDLQPTWKNVSKGTSSHQEKQLCQIILTLMQKCRSYGPDKSGWMHACTTQPTAHIIRTEVVTIMSASGLHRKLSYGFTYFHICLSSPKMALLEGKFFPIRVAL